jgi:hypothetical protein
VHTQGVCHILSFCVVTVSVSAFTWAIVCGPQSARLSLCLARSSRLGGGRASRDRGQFGSDTYLAQRTHTRRRQCASVCTKAKQPTDGRTETLLLFSPVGNRSVCVGATLDPIWPRAGWFRPLPHSILHPSTEEIHRFDTKTLVFGPERVSATLNACRIIYARQTHAEKLFCSRQGSDRILLMQENFILTNCICSISVIMYLCCV